MDDNDGESQASLRVGVRRNLGVGGGSDLQKTTWVVALASES